MKRIKNMLAIILSVVIILVMVSGCGKTNEMEEAHFSIVTILEAQSL